MRNHSSLTVHFTHELANKVLPVHESLMLNRFPARQHGIPMVVARQLDVGDLVLLLAITLTAVARTYP